MLHCALCTQYNMASSSLENVVAAFENALAMLSTYMEQQTHIADGNCDKIIELNKKGVQFAVKCIANITRKKNEYNKVLHSRHRTPWTDEDNNKLIIVFQTHYPHADVLEAMFVHELKRTSKACLFQLHKLIRETGALFFSKHNNIPVDIVCMYEAALHKA